MYLVQPHTSPAAHDKNDNKNFFQVSLGKNKSVGGGEKQKHSCQPVFLWALKLYAFCNKNIKKHRREAKFMLEHHKFWGSF